MNPDKTILTTTKTALGVAIEDDSFDSELLLFINVTVSFLFQLGVLNLDELIIVDQTTGYETITKGDISRIIVMGYINCKVKQQFDPPSSAAAIQSLQQLINEYEWRLTCMGQMKPTQ